MLSRTFGKSQHTFHGQVAREVAITNQDTRHFLRSPSKERGSTMARKIAAAGDSKGDGVGSGSDMVLGVG
jgi:hypothetical protein